MGRAHPLEACGLYYFFLEKIFKRHLTPDPLAWDLPYFATMDQGSSLAKLAESSLPAHPRRLSLTPDP